jgi:hypothetical protein
MVLNALSIDPKRPWKGSWRWFHEKLLDCCLPLDTVEREGVVLTQVNREGKGGRRGLGGGAGCSRTGSGEGRARIGSWLTVR